MRDCWPDVLDLPTGPVPAKTAALDARPCSTWALRAGRTSRNGAPRIVLVVDDAHGRAEKIAAALRDPEPDQPVVREVRRRLPPADPYSLAALVAGGGRV